MDFKKCFLLGLKVQYNFSLENKDLILSKYVVSVLRCK